MVLMLVRKMQNFSIQAILAKMSEGVEMKVVGLGSLKTWRPGASRLPRSVNSGQDVRGS